MQRAGDRSAASLAVSELPDLAVLSADALRTLLVTTHEQLLSREREVEHLTLLLAKLHRLQFGRKSEKLRRQIEQLELRLEDLESNRSEKEPKAPESAAVPASATPTVAKPARRVLPDHLPRETRPHRKRRCVRSARANCASWARMSRKYWSTCLPVLG